MVAKLRVKPVGDGACECPVAGAVGDLGAVWQVAIDDLDALEAGLQRGEAGHLFAVDRRRVCEVAAPKGNGLLAQVSSDQANLLAIARVVSDHALAAACRGRVEDMRRGVK